MEAPNTPGTRKERPEYDTPKKVRFFDRFDHKKDKETTVQIASQPDIAISAATASRWLKQRQELGKKAERRSNNRHKRGRKPLLASDDLDKMLDDSNPVRDQPYEYQEDFFNIQANPKTFRRNFQKRRNAGRFIQASSKEIRKLNVQERQQYGEEHISKTIEDFWQYVHFVDEMHINPDKTQKGRILRQQGTRNEPENRQQQPGKRKYPSLHASISVSWNHIGKLVFYRDEGDETQLPVRKKPRRRPKTETNEQYKERLRQWEAEQPHSAEIHQSGNSMTQKYYAEHLLPNHIAHIKADEARGQAAYLQEDNDPSHGTRSADNVAKRKKDQNNVQLIKQPAQSPDLNAAEAIWNVLKQKIPYYNWESIQDLKDVLEDIRASISLEQVRRRIAEMPWRCEQIKTRPDIIIKSDLW